MCRWKNWSNEAVNSLACTLPGSWMDGHNHLRENVELISFVENDAHAFRKVEHALVIYREILQMINHPRRVPAAAGMIF